jgi:uncharacterized membrane protein YcaP (DUF421 family)
MDTVLRGAAVYLLLLILFRLTGKRSLAETTVFDFVLLLIISEAIQQGLVGEDHSLTHALVLVVTLLGLDVALSMLKQRSPAIDRLVDSVPVVILVDGRPLKERLDRERIGEEDILEQARLLHGLERLDQIRFAVLERNGAISIIPQRPS